MIRLLSLLLAAFIPFAASAQESAFLLRPGDRIEIEVLRDSSLRGHYPVDERGRAILPLLGERVVTSTPWHLLRDSLTLAYQRELADPAVRITPQRRVVVLGFVQRPGVYFADPTVSIAGAVALAGGASVEGDLRRIRVLRDSRELFASVGMDDARVLGELQSGDQVYVDRRGWFDRNAPLFVSAVVGVASIIVTLIVAR